MGDHLGTFPPISVSIDETSPKLLWWIALVKLYKPTSFWIKTHRGAGSVGKKFCKIRNPDETSYQMGCHAKSSKYMPYAHQSVSERGPGTSASKATKPQDPMTTGPHDHRATAIIGRPNQSNQPQNQQPAWSCYEVLIRVRVRVTELVYQIGFTTLFKSQGRENILAASSKQQQQQQASKQAASKQQASSSSN